MKRSQIYLLIYYLSPLVPIGVIYSSNPFKYSEWSFLLPMIIGATAFTWINAQLIISARPKFIEKYFGLDKMYKFHGIMALISILIVYVHKLIKTYFFGETFTGELAEKAWMLLVITSVLALLLMADTFILKIKLVRTIKNYLKKFYFAKYQYQILIHNLTVIAIITMFIHVMLTGAARTNLGVRIVFISYFNIGIGFYIYHKVFKSLILKRRLFVVQDITKENSNMWTLKLVPQYKNGFSFKAGQFGFLRLFREGLTSEEHPFSIASSPLDKPSILITIKALGDYTSKIQHVKIGDKASFEGPFGRFSYLNYPNEEQIVLIVGGVGITPALSMLRDIRYRDKGKKVMLIWGINTSSDIISIDELETIQREMKNFVMVPVAFKDETWLGETGIINGERIERLLNTNKFDIQASGYYICGPAAMLDNVLYGLKGMRVNRKNIHYEKFSI